MKKILIIEDSKDIRENTCEILQLADYQVSTAENGKAGVELAKQLKPDLILCDIMMPELDGYGVINILSKNPETSAIPFIFFSAKAEKDDFRKGMNLGADDYIAKPFTDIDLMAAIESRLDKVGKKKAGEGPGFAEGSRGLEALRTLSDNRKTKTFRKKEEIYRQDDYANYLYFIIKGKVKSIKTDSYGKTFVNDIYGNGAFIGYATLLENGEYHETTIALSETEVAIIPKADFVELVQKNRDVAVKFINELSVNLQERDKRLLQLAYTPVRERVAHALLMIKDKMTPLDNSDEIRISRDDLAGIVGTAKESLIRMLSEIRKEGLIETDGHSIKILDEKGLKRISCV
jgi:CRP/FNR family transcriptional regulator, polysaccharide utilization system transcription regulator